MGERLVYKVGWSWFKRAFCEISLLTLQGPIKAPLLPHASIKRDARQTSN